MRPVFAYIRVSTTKQGERGSSLQEQRSAIEAYARRNNLSIAEWFEEQETAAKQGRRIFNQMVALLRTGQASGVIIHKIDRSARNLRDWADIGDLIDQGVEVHFAHETLDLQSRGGRLSADIQAVVAADYIRNLRDEVLKGFYGRLKQGFFPLPAPIGYLDQGGGKAKILDPAKEPLVRRLFELYASGKYSLPMLVDEAERMGLRNRGGGKVSLSGVSQILNNEFYIGLIRIRRTGETFKGAHPALVSTTLFEAVQARLSGKRKNQGLKHDFLYRKLLRCASCGFNLIGERQKGIVYYRCHTKGCPPTSIREEDLQVQAADAIELLRFFPEEYEELTAEFLRYEQELLGKREERIKAATVQLGQLDERLGRLTDAYIDRLIDRELFENRKGALLQERLKLDEQLVKLRDGKTGKEIWFKEILELLDWLTDAEYGTKPFDIRDILQKVASNLIVDRDILLVDWRIPFGDLASGGDSSSGGPYRGTPRTFRDWNAAETARRTSRKRRGSRSMRCILRAAFRGIGGLKNRRVDTGRPVSRRPQHPSPDDRSRTPPR